jgi:hypothetical protein
VEKNTPNVTNAIQHVGCKECFHGIDEGRSAGRTFNHEREEVLCCILFTIEGLSIAAKNYDKSHTKNPTRPQRSKH